MISSSDRHDEVGVVPCAESGRTPFPEFPFLALPVEGLVRFRSRVPVPGLLEVLFEVADDERADLGLDLSFGFARRLAPELRVFDYESVKALQKGRHFGSLFPHCAPLLITKLG